MTSDTHQGYTNYATFGVSVVLANDEQANRTTHGITAQIKQRAGKDENVTAGIWTAEQAIRFNLADTIKSYVEGLCEVGVRDADTAGSLMAAQMVQAGLAEVNWEEIADEYLDES